MWYTEINVKSSWHVIFFSEVIFFCYFFLSLGCSRVNERYGQEIEARLRCQVNSQVLIKSVVEYIKL